MHATNTLAEADRLMTVCNSCRYCEGICAVFPAMEMRRAFSDGDLNYLANLCHNCGACYYDCQFSPPHEFNVNVPKVLAQVRTESYEAYAWPGCLAGSFRRNGLVISIVAALSIAIFIIGFVASGDRNALFAANVDPGAFYRVIAAQRDGRAVRRGVRLCAGSDGDGRAEFLARHRRARGHPDARFVALAGNQRRVDIALSRWRRRRLHERGREADRQSAVISSPDVLRLHAVSGGDVGGDAVSLRRPRGAVSVVGSAGAAGHVRRHRPDRRAAGFVARESQTRSGDGRAKKSSAWTWLFSRCCS